MHEQDLVAGSGARYSQQTVVDEDPSPNQASPFTDMSLGSTVYRSLHAEQVAHITKYVHNLAQYPDTEVMLIVISEEPSGTNFLGLPQKNIFTFASLKLQPLLARIERNPRFGRLAHTGNPQGDDLSDFANALSLVFLAFSLLLSLSVLASVLFGMVATATVFVSFLSMFLWGRVLVQRKTQPEYQRLEDEMDQEPGSKENIISSHSLANQAEIAELQAAIAGVACDISTNGTKIWFRLESEEAIFNYGSSELKHIFASISSQQEPQTAIRNLDKRIDYKLLCLVFSTVILFDIAMYFKWYTVENIEVFVVSAVYCMLFNSIFAVRLLYMYTNGIE